MKIRNGFVSNSSSSSFVCLVCGEECSGMDIGITDAGMRQCTNGHVFCEDHGSDVPERTPQEQLEIMLNMAYGPSKDELNALDLTDEDDLCELTDLWEDYRYELEDEGCDPNECPICRFEVENPTEAIHYLLAKLNWTTQDLLQNMSSEYSEYADFQQFIKERKNAS